MMCQNCHHREAVNHFVIQYMGTEKEMHLCDECAAQAKQYMGAMIGQYGPKAMLGNMWGGGQEEPSSPTIEETPFPEDAGEEVKKQRQMNALKHQLKEAVEAEKYEKAAVLRDRIKKLKEEGVCAHEL